MLPLFLQDAVRMAGCRQDGRMPSGCRDT